MDPSCPAGRYCWKGRSRLARKLLPFFDARGAGSQRAWPGSAVCSRPADSLLSFASRRRVFPACVGMNRERADGLAGEGSIPHSRGDGRANIWTRGMTKSPPARGAPHAETPLPHETEEAFCYHGNRDGIPAVCELFSYSTTFGVPDTGRVPVRMKVSTRPKTRSLPQKCPRAMEARNSGRRSSKRRSKAGSRVIMSACMP